MTKWNNTIFFENGIKHELTVEEINVIKMTEIQEIQKIISVSFL